MKWIKFSEKKPQCPGIYAIIIYRKEGYSAPYDLYRGVNKKLITHNLPSNTQVIWAIWKYMEIFEEVTEEKVIYRKVHTFINSDGDPVVGAVYWASLPKIPRDLVISEDSDSSIT